MDKDKTAVLDNTYYQAAFSEENGCIRHIIDKKTGKSVCLGNLDEALWKLYFRDRTSISSNQFAAENEDKHFSYTLSGKELIMSYESADVNVKVVFVASGHYLDSKVTVANPREVVLTLNYPQKTTFNVDSLNRFHFPHDLGVAFKKPFYTAGHNSQSFAQGTYSSGYGDVHTQGGRYPNLFSDFVFLDSKDGTMGIYGIQPEESIFVPCTLCTASDPGRRSVPYYDHSFNTYVKPGEEWISPVLRIEVSTSLKEAIQTYCQGNGFKRTLVDKMKAEVYDKFRKSVLLHYRSRKLARGEHFTFKEDTKALDKFAEFSPIQMHISDYMMGNFDKQYPDMLPPNPVKGTMEELKRFYDRAHELGMIVCPYDNPTWFCEAPPAPSLEEHGDSVLAKDLDGDVVREYYYGNEGYALTFAHPILKKIRERNIKLFTQDLPSDIIMQDQLGARSWIYDTNPAAGVPYAYTQGIINIAKEDCEHVPLSTEDGFD